MYSEHFFWMYQPKILKIFSFWWKFYSDLSPSLDLLSRAWNPWKSMIFMKFNLFVDQVAVKIPGSNIAYIKVLRTIVRFVPTKNVDSFAFSWKILVKSKPIPWFRPQSIKPLKIMIFHKNHDFSDCLFFCYGRLLAVH